MSGGCEITDSVKSFYGAKERASVLTSIGCPRRCEEAPAVAEGLRLLHPKVKESYLGCGLPYPGAVEGCRVLDLGSGAGRDVFLLSYLAGAKGEVVGVDMTPAMIERANDMIPYHKEKFGFGNVSFKLGYLESLDQIPDLQPESFDVIISNCVICLTKDKPRVFAQAFRLLKPGGELCFSDIYTNEPLSGDVRFNELVWNEGFGGATTWAQLASAVTDMGFLPPLRFARADYAAVDAGLKGLVGEATFESVTARIFKPSPGGTGAAAVEYLGTLAEAPKALRLSLDHTFQKGERVDVTSEISRALQVSRFAAHFAFH